MSNRVALIARATVVLISEHEKQVSLVDSKGEFLFRLAPGRYRICFGAVGFRQSCRAPFDVKGGRNLTFHSLLVPKGYVDPVGKDDIPSSLYAYREETIDIRSPNLSALVGFGTRKQKADGVCYGPTRLLGDVVMPVRLSYDNYTVEANEVCVSTDKADFAAKGNVTVDDATAENGGTVCKAKRLEVSFRNGTPIFSDGPDCRLDK